MSNQFARLTLKEYQEISRKAHDEYRKALGPRPSYKSIQKDIPNPFSITLIEWLALAVLVVLTVFTTYKVGALAVPFADAMLSSLTAHTSIHPMIASSFKVVTVVLFAMLATPGLIYMTLLDADQEIVEQKEHSAASLRWYQRLSLRYVTPRLPILLTYAITVWLFVVSSVGATDVASLMARYIPVVTEVALAHLAGVLLKKRSDHVAFVWNVLTPRMEDYDQKLHNYEQDEDYLRQLYQYMREALPRVKRGQERPNEWLLDAPDLLRQAVIEEYWRLNNIEGFVPPPEPQAEEIRIEKRIPPKGAKQWTVDALRADLLTRGIQPGVKYTEQDVNRDYAKGYGAREAWREGVKTVYAIGSK